jgi:hypothetical protein
LQQFEVKRANHAEFARGFIETGIFPVSIPHLRSLKELPVKLKLSIAALLLVSACPFAAQAAGVSANLGASYTNFTNAGGTDAWNVDGALNYGLGGNWGAEVTAGYHDFSGHNGGNGGLALWYSDPGYRLALSSNYFSLGGIELTNVGLGGEWFASEQWTASLRGGYFRAAGSSTDGGYVGGDAKFYITPNLALNAGVDYLGASGSITSEDITAEWLTSQTTPISIFGGYQHQDVSGGGNLDIVFVGLRLYMEPGNGTLVERQRTGNLGYIDGMPYFGKVL